MPDSKTIELTEPLPEDAESQNTSPFLMAKLKALIASQRHNIKSLSVLVFINFLVAGLGFVTKVKIANTLGKADFGLFSYGFALAAYGGAIIRFGFDRTLVRDLIHHPDKKGQIVAASVILRGLLFALVTTALLIWKFFSPATSDLTWGVILIVLGNSMLGLELIAIYDSMGQFSRHSVYNLIQRCLYFIAVWTMIIFSPKYFSIFWLGVFTVTSISLYLLLQGKWLFRQLDFTDAFESIGKATFKLVKSNFVVWSSSIAGLSFGILSQLILKYYNGKESLGIYASAWQLLSVVMLFLNQLSRIGNPAIARLLQTEGNIKTRSIFVIKYLSVMTIGILPIGVAYIFFPTNILNYMYKPEYCVAAPILRILGIYAVIFSWGLVASQYVISSRKESLYFISLMLGGMLSIVCCLLLIPIYAGLGAAISVLIGHTFSMSIYFIYMILDIRRKR